MSELPQSAADLASLRTDLAALKSDVGSLIAHLKSDARNGAQGAADQLSGGVRAFTQGAVNESQQSAQALGAWVEQKPLLACLIAAGVVFVGARALLR